jgi:hypothetical protein
MNLRSTGLLTIALAGALAASACTTMAGDQTMAQALNTGTRSSPAVLPLDETHGRLIYGGVSSTLPKEHQLTNREILATFRHHRAKFQMPRGVKDLAFGRHTVTYTRPDGRATTGHWRVRNDKMCVKWRTSNESCYTVYSVGANQYSMWFNDEPRGQMTIL